MARKKRKYIRRKMPRHDTVPLSAIFVGLLPVVLMASIVGIYIIYQYTDIIRTVSFPEISSLPSLSPDITLPSISLPAIHMPEIHLPEIQFPEVTLSFDEVFQAFGALGIGVLDFFMTLAERTVQFIGLVGVGSLSFVQTGGQTVLIGISQFIIWVEQFLSELHGGISVYFQTLTWTVGDFFTYLDLPAKGQAMYSMLLWPLHFLDPRPALQVAAEKVNEMNQAVVRFFAPFMPIVDYLWKSIQESAAELWKGIVDAITFLTWLISQGSK